MIHLDQICKHYSTPQGTVKALDTVDLHVAAGEFVVIRGPSGSGKSTLLLTLGGMLHPSSGRVLVNNTAVYDLNHGARSRFRAAQIGFVFQTFHLIPYLSARENVMLPAGMEKGPHSPADADQLLSRFRLSERIHHKPEALSAGEQQRTAIARALLKRPTLLLADEPTGNLDPDNAGEIFGYLEEYHRAGGTVLVVTHGQAADAFADRIVYIRQGRIEAVPS